MPRPVGAWTKDKLKVLGNYLPGYLQATTRATERIYVDAFSGPGENVLDDGALIDGSPLIALDALARNGTQFSKLFFIERNPTVAQELRDNLSVRDRENRAQVIHGDVNSELPKLVRTLSRQSPIFAFIDPTGIEPGWTTIEQLSHWRTEMLINFPLGMSINRNAMRGPAKIDSYFGTDEWRGIYHSAGTGRVRRLLDLYKTRLASLGYRHTVDDDRLVKTIDGKKLYYLVFVSKVEVAATIMRWVFKQPDSRGQTQMEI